MFTIAYDPVYSHPLLENHRFPMLKYELMPGQLMYEGVITEENLFSIQLLEEDIVLQHIQQITCRHENRPAIAPKDNACSGILYRFNLGVTPNRTFNIVHP